MITILVLVASVALAQPPNAAQERAAEQEAQRALDDALQQQRVQQQAAYIADRKALLASSYFTIERLHWTLALAVESLPEAQRVGLKDDAEAVILALSSARKTIAGPWSPSAPTLARQDLEKAGGAAKLLAAESAAVPALALKDHALWIEGSAAKVRKDLPSDQTDWEAMRAQTRCYALERSVRVKGKGAPDSAYRVYTSSALVYAPGALPAIGGERFSWQAGGKAEAFSLSDFSMDGTTLKAKLGVQSSSSPADPSTFKLEGEKDASYPLDRPIVYDRTLDSEDFRITLTEKEAAPDVCHLTRASAEALFDLPAD